MKRIFTGLLFSLGVGAASFLAGCGDDDGSEATARPPVGAGASSADGPRAPSPTTTSPPAPPSPPPGAGSSDAGTTAPKIYVRVAHLVPSAGAAGVQVCVKRVGTDFAAADLPATPRLNYKDVTGYLALDPGVYKARVVAMAATNCAAPVIAGLADTELPNLPAGAYATAAAVGKLAALASTNGYRAITATATRITLGASTSATGRLAWASDAIAAGGLPALGIRTAFAIDKVGAAAPGDVDVLVCDDQATANSTTRLNASCAVLSTTDELLHLRVAHLSPDAPAVRVCVVPAAGAFSAAILPVTPSLTFRSVTGYLDVLPGSYKARIVAGAATTCATPLASLPDYTLPALPRGTFATAAAVGRVAATGATAFTVAPYVDLLATPATGNAHLRFIHAAPATNIPVFVGAANPPNLAAALFRAVPFKGTDPTLAPTNGYRPLPINQTRVELGASASATGALVWSSGAIETSGLAALSIQTVFAIDRGTAVGDVDVLYCDDARAGDATTKLNASCAILPRL